MAESSSSSSSSSSSLSSSSSSLSTSSSSLVIRGLWLLERGIVDRWKDKGLDATFRSEWTGDIRQYPVLHDGMARPVPPGPYCVYEILEPVIVTHQSGHESFSELQTFQALVQFRIHAKSSVTETGFEIAIRLAEAVALAYDDRTPLAVKPDTEIVSIREADITIREGDNEWSYVLQYQYLIDAVYRT